jgi:threonine/homoserine/homoserine lactone efflux protein
MLEIIIKGIIIGLFISVPLGPIGMLCVQRTLNRGRKYGMITGLGASTSDLVYTIIALFFISFVADFLETNKIIIQVVGSLVVIGFGVFIFRSNPSTQPLPNQTTQESMIGDYFSSFILTLSNPLILFVLIGLFARFDFLNSNTTTITYVSGISAILAGACLWWAILTFFTSKFRDKLSYRGLKTLNRAIGLIILIFGILGISYNLYIIFFK